MNISHNILFFFSALGAFNGLFLSLYFGFFAQKRSRELKFLAALLFVISVRVTKSVFLSFYPEISDLFVHIGLTACFLIGPFQYLYTRVTHAPNSITKWNWIIHVVPIVLFMAVIGHFYPYSQYKYLWWRTPPRPLGILLLSQWSIYLTLALYGNRKSFKNVFSKSEKTNVLDAWMVTINIGGFIIWLAYSTTMYTSYIVGALSFSFTFYITLFIWFLKRRMQNLSFLSPTQKYGNRKIEAEEITRIEKELQELFTLEKVHRDPNLKLSHVAEKIGVSSHQLSQYLNEQIGKSFSLFVNEHRVNCAKQMIQENDLLTLEAIGKECGFRSNTTFYGAFKKVLDQTPAQYKQSQLA
ncbi:MAG: helix-turn-helix domain-containing protein [Bacteroidota bacterium]